MKLRLEEVGAIEIEVSPAELSTLGGAAANNEIRHRIIDFAERALRTFAQVQPPGRVARPDADPAPDLGQGRDYLRQLARAVRTGSMTAIVATEYLSDASSEQFPSLDAYVRECGSLHSAMLNVWSDGEAVNAATDQRQTERSDALASNVIMTAAALGRPLPPHWTGVPGGPHG